MCQKRRQAEQLIWVAVSRHLEQLRTTPGELRWKKAPPKRIYLPTDKPAK